MDKIAVLIPCYNESATIAKVIADYRAVLPEATIYVYDNNSSDGTDKIARAAGPEVRYDRVRVMLFALCFVILKRIAI